MVLNFKIKTQILLILNMKINMSWTYIEEKLIETSKVSIFYPAYSSSGMRGLEPFLAAQGTRQDPPWTGQPSITRHITPKPTLTQIEAMKKMPFTFHAHLWDVARKPKSLEKTHIDMGECKKHIDCGPHPESIVLFLSTL